MKKIFATLVTAGIVGVSLSAAETITLGTGGLRGNYHPVGGAICKIVNKTTSIRCNTESTRGSFYNVNTLKTEEIDFGIVQGDIAYEAFKGEDKFKGGQIADLRSVMAIYPELLSFVVSKKSGIQKMSDIQGKKISVDSPGSGTAMTTSTVFDAFGIKASDISLAEIKAAECPTALQENRIDGYFFMVGHPTNNIKDAASFSDIALVPIEGAPVNKLTQKYPYYTKGMIPASSYKGVTSDVPTLGVKAVLVTNAKVKDDVVYQITKTILDNFNEFKELHPVLKGQTVTRESLLDGLGIPQHPGAMRAFKEANLLR